VHALVVLLILIAMAQPIVPVMRHVPEPILMSLVEREPPPPALPEPPPPTVQHKVKPVRTPPPVPVTPPTPMSTPTPPASSVESTASETVAATPGPAAQDIGNAPTGETQALAYATPVTPVYPPASKHALEQGTVVLRVLVDATGAPQRVEIAKSSGHTRLDMAARASVLRAKFRPVLRDGTAVPAWGLVPIAFRLDQG
jgi:protein TonB